MKKTVLIFLSLIAISGCTKGGETVRVLESQGFSNIEITGYRLFGCDEKDLFHTGFKALSPNGVSVDGVVCAGFLKGSTVRFD